MKRILALHFASGPINKNIGIRLVYLQLLLIRTLTNYRTIIHFKSQFIFGRLLIGCTNPQSSTKSWHARRHWIGLERCFMSKIQTQPHIMTENKKAQFESLYAWSIFFPTAPFRRQFCSNLPTNFPEDPKKIVATFTSAIQILVEASLYVNLP